VVGVLPDFINQASLLMEVSLEKKMLVNCYRYDNLEELLSNVLIINAALFPTQAKRYLKQSILVAESIGGMCEKLQ